MTTALATAFVARPPPDAARDANVLVRFGTSRLPFARANRRIQGAGVPWFPLHFLPGAVRKAQEKGIVVSVDGGRPSGLGLGLGLGLELGLGHRAMRMGRLAECGS